MGLPRRRLLALRLRRAGNLRSGRTLVRPRSGLGASQGGADGALFIPWLRRSARHRPVIAVALVAVAIFGLAAAAGAGVIRGYSQGLPDPGQLQSRVIPEDNFILDRAGNVLLETRASFGHRLEVPLSAVAPPLVQATIAVEDRDFYHNPGISLERIFSAGYQDFLSGHVNSGASTITQQLVKNTLLNASDRSVGRKIREILLALEMTRRYPKAQILDLYLNTIYYGRDAYGVEAATRTYFGKDASALTLPEATFLAGLPQSPSRFDPYIHYDLARARQADVLAAMVRAGDITASQSSQAFAVNIQSELAYAVGKPFPERAPHFVNNVLEWMVKHFGQRAVDSGGLVVQTTLDPGMQAAAEGAVTTTVQNLAYKNVNNGALLAMDPHTGDVLAMVGSANYWDPSISGQYNMATQAARQPGSSFKPYTYAAAFQSGQFDGATMTNDTQGKVTGTPFEDWDNHGYGRISLRDALIWSRNIPAVKLMYAAGVNNVLDLAHNMGITTPLKAELGTTLGSSEVKMIDHVTGFSTFANLGLRRDPRLVLAVHDRWDHNVYKAPPEPGVRVLDARVAYMITDMLQHVSDVFHFSRPVATKTGTTNNFVDSWTVGYIPDLVAAGWVGHTGPGVGMVPMDTVWGWNGGGAIFRRFMDAVMPRYPVTWYSAPAGLEYRHVCAGPCYTELGLPQTNPYRFFDMTGDGGYKLVESYDVPQPSPSPTSSPAPVPPAAQSPAPSPPALPTPDPPTPAPPPPATVPPAPTATPGG